MTDEPKCCPECDGTKKAVILFQDREGNEISYVGDCPLCVPRKSILQLEQQIAYLKARYERIVR